MPEIARLGRQTTIRELARRLFPGQDDADGLRRAEEALVAANPALGDRVGFRPGAPVIVPDLGGRAARRSAGRETAEPEAVLAALARSVEALDEAAADALAGEQRDAEAAAAVLRGPEAHGAMRRRHPDLVDQLPALADLLEERAKGADARMTALRSVIGEAARDLAMLRDAAPGQR
jgi:hypothetical protein